MQYRVTGGLRCPSRIYHVTTHNYQHVSTLYGTFQVVYFVQFEWKFRRALAYTGLNILSVYKTKVRYEN